MNKGPLHLHTGGSFMNSEHSQQNLVGQPWTPKETSPSPRRLPGKAISAEPVQKQAERTGWGHEMSCMPKKNEFSKLFSIVFTYVT